MQRAHCPSNVYRWSAALRFLARVSSEQGQIHLRETELKTTEGKIFPARLTGTQLFDDGEPMGMSFSVQDMSEIRRLEKEKM